MQRSGFCLVAAFGLLAGCASNPHVTYSYHPAKLHVATSVTETVSCTADKTNPVYQVAVVVTPTYVADQKQTWSLTIPRGMLSDTDFTASFTDDGRLTSINSTLTGEGGTILKDVVQLGTALAAAGAAPTVATLAICNGLLKQPISIIYDRDLDFADYVPAVTPLLPRSYMAPLDAALRKGLPDMPSFQAVITIQRPEPNRVTFANSDLTGSFAVLKLRPVENANLQIKDQKHGIVIYDSELPIPKPGPGYYEVALPKSAIFGSSTFALTLSDSGAIKTIGYKATNGTASAVEVGTAAAYAAAPQSAAEIAAQIKAQADIIAQQQRLARCIAHPTTCT